MYIESLSVNRGGRPDVIIGDADSMPWLRSELDRPIDSVHVNFMNAFGADATPMQVAIDMAREKEREELSILEVGGGTGNTMRTLVDMVALNTGLDRSHIRGTVLNNNDFSQESASTRTRRVIASGGIAYLIGDAQELPFDNVPENSYDLVYSYEVMLYLRRPQELAQRLTRLAKPAGHILFNARGRQAPLIDAALAEVPGEWEAQSATIGCADDRGKTQMRTFYHLIKAA